MAIHRRFVVLVHGLGLGAVLGVACGAASALFLWLLDQATATRTTHEAIVFALPVAGLAIGWLYERFGAAIKGGTNLVIDTIHDGGPEVPLRLAPMVLVGTVLTHLFGGSAGREGTAVQMGAGLTDWLSHRLRVSAALRQQLLVAGVAGGFGSVFGTPFAGVVFGLEVVALRRLHLRALVPALVAAVVGDLTTRGLGITHVPYPTLPALALSPLLLLKWLVVALAVAAVAVVFIEATHLLKRVPVRLPIRMFVGGLVIIGLWQVVGTSDYLGLGVPLIGRALHDPALPAYAFALKLAFTIVTLGAGFLGGEVTPLFVIGATLGSALAVALGIPVEFGAAVGLAAMFAAASNTPLALTVMAVELFGVHVLPHVAIVCAIAYVVTGRRSIYPAQLTRRAPVAELCDNAGAGPRSNADAT